MPVIQAESSERGVLYRLSLPGNPAYGGRDRAMLLTAFMLTLAAPSTAVVGFEGPKYCAQALNQQAQSLIGIKTSHSSAGVVVLLPSARLGALLGWGPPRVGVGTAKLLIGLGTAHAACEVDRQLRCHFTR